MPPIPEVSESIKEFLKFIDNSPSPFHAVQHIADSLRGNGFQPLSESGSWAGRLVNGSKYYFSRNGSSIVAFAVGGKFSIHNGSGMAMIGAHTDSPCFKVKPVSKLTKAGFQGVGVECYGGGLWHTWFDRDLTVAGKVIIRDPATQKPVSKLVHVKRPILRIPSLAIHLYREIYNEGFKPNNENHLTPIIATEIKGKLETPVEGNETESGTSELDPRHHSILLQVIADELGCSAASILDFELSITDTQPAAVGGALNELVFSPRLDNLASCWTGLRSFLSHAETDLANSKDISLLVCFDHEEVGSTSMHGANSSLIPDTIDRLTACLDSNIDADKKLSFIRRSYMISADMAHACHPNYPEKHEDRHKVAFHKGTVIKTNSNQRYATSGISGFILREIARIDKVPLQEFVVRNDSPCGSTIGPMLSAKTGLRVIDVGTPQLAMHSCREVCAGDDLISTINLFYAFYKYFRQVDDSIGDQGEIVE